MSISHFYLLCHLCPLHLCPLHLCPLHLCRLCDFIDAQILDNQQPSSTASANTSTSHLLRQVVFTRTLWICLLQFRQSFVHGIYSTACPYTNHKRKHCGQAHL